MIGVASTAPAYSLAATLGFVVAAIGLQAPIVTILAFVPMYFISVGYNELNKADPDCGTTFTWATRAFGPITGWLGGWGIVAADVLVMASLAQVAGQYLFDLFNTSSIGGNATSVWVLLVGVGWIVVMTAICYVGIEVSANFQKALLGIELTMLTVLSVWALVKVGNGTAPAGHLVPAGSWFNPFKVKSASSFIVGLADMLFIYWGWDTTVSINEETANSETVPGRAAIISTFVLLGVYALVVLSVESFAGIGSTGIGLGNANNTGDVLSILGPAVFGHSGFAVGAVTSAAADGPLLGGRLHPDDHPPDGADDAFDGGLPGDTKVFRQDPQEVPDTECLHRGDGSCLDRPLRGHELPVRRLGHLGLGLRPGRHDRLLLRPDGFRLCLVLPQDSDGELPQPARAGDHPCPRGCHPVDDPRVGVLVLLAARQQLHLMDAALPPHWQMGGVFVIDALTIILGLVLMFVQRGVRPQFFRGETLNRDTATLVPESAGMPVGSVNPRPSPSP